MVAELILVRDAEVAGRIVDVTWSDGVVRSVQGRSGRAVGRRGRVVDAQGAALLPGLHDHHLHLLALAAARSSIHAGPPTVADVAGFTRVMSAACIAAGGGQVRAVGYDESVAGPLDAATLDRLVPAGQRQVVRVQHRGGQMWVLNRHALALARIEDLQDARVERDARGRATGRVFGLDGELRRRLGRTAPDVAAVGRELASYGVTSVTDLTPTTDPAELALLADAVLAPSFPLRVTVTGGPGMEPDRFGLDVGPVKLLPPDHSDPDLDALVAGIRAAHDSGRSVAVHCVTRVGLVVAVAAWRTAGAMHGDRIEHGAVVPDELVEEVASLGLVVVTQPNLVAERGDRYLAAVDPEDRDLLWRCRTLRERGVGVAGGTDAPFGHPDPWRAIAAAIDRRTAGGRVLGAVERLDPPGALDLFLGDAMAPTTPRRIAPGDVTDLCLLDRRLEQALADPRAVTVRCTLGRADGPS